MEEGRLSMSCYSQNYLVQIPHNRICGALTKNVGIPDQAQKNS